MMCDLMQKVNKSIERLKNFAPENDSYYVCYSGGKDSDCIRILCELANVPYDLHYNLTTADAPETVRYIKSLGNVSIDKARYSDGRHKTMWNLIPQKKMPPTRLVRYCCAELKEWGGKGRFKVTGVRWSESRSRAESGGLLKVLGKPKKVQKFADQNYISYYKTRQGGIVLNYDNSSSRRLSEFCYRTTNTMLNPIIDWDECDVWEFLKYYGCESNPLYKCGFKRVGCIGCPMGGGRSQKREFALYPKIRDNYIRAFDKMLLNNPDFGLEVYGRFSSGLYLYRWWIEENPFQTCFEGFNLAEL